MLLDARILDGGFTEDEYKFLQVIARHAKGNEIVPIGEDELKQEAEQANVKTEDFEDLLRKMEDVSVIKRTLPKQPELQVHSSAVKAIQGLIEQVTCPKCKKPGLQKVTKRRCRICGEEYDNED